jgi:hypothetical protein
VSNNNVQPAVYSLCCLLCTISVQSQSAPLAKTKLAAIQSAKHVIVRSIDRSLPKVTLEFFLNYEAEGSTVKWDAYECRGQAGNPATRREHDVPLCVEADAELRNGTSVAVILSRAPTELQTSSVPILCSVTVVDLNGRRSLNRLGDLPMELHRPPPRMPRDLPASVSALFIFWL